MKHHFLPLIALMLLGTMPFKALAQQKATVLLDDSTRFDIQLAPGEKVGLPVRHDGKKYGLRDVTSIELAAGEKAIDGYTRWEVQEVATPSLILGRRHTELRLLGVVEKSADGKATVYQWETVHGAQGNQRLERWCGVLLDGSDTVYPFVQNDKVWLRDLQMVWGSEQPDFVENVRNYYIKQKARVAKERQEKLRSNPASILQLTH